MRNSRETDTILLGVVVQRWANFQTKTHSKQNKAVTKQANQREGMKTMNENKSHSQKWVEMCLLWFALRQVPCNCMSSRVPLHLNPCNRKRAPHCSEYTLRQRDIEFFELLMPITFQLLNRTDNTLGGGIRILQQERRAKQTMNKDGSRHIIERTWIDNERALKDIHLR